MNTQTTNVATSAEEAAKIVPRAEFRVFGKDIVAAMQEKIWDTKATLHTARTMPAEIYFLSARTNEANVKVRDALLDIKTKVGETPEGYEIFQPRGKFEFPIRKVELQTILGHLKVELELKQETYTLDDFVTLARMHPDLCPVTVEKKRYGFMVQGVICEYARVWFNGAMVESACCESEDYAGMKKVVQALGLSTQPNTNYLRAAKRIIGMA